MASRAVGALLGLAATGLIAVSLATSAWWDGHPRVAGHTISAKDAHIGLWSATGCNSGGAGDCVSLEIGDTFKKAALGELALAGLAALLVFAVAIAGFRASEHQKRLGAFALIAVVLAGAGGGLMLVLGPAIQSSQSVDVPIGWGTFVFGGGIASGLLGALFSTRTRPEPLRLKTSQGAIQPPPAAFDVRDVLREQHDLLRPSALGPEPKLGQSDARALGVMETPLFEGAPQLRPLYDREGAGIVPAPQRPVLPTRGPTPVPVRTPIPVRGGEPKTINALPPPPVAVERAESEPIDPPPPRPMPPPVAKVLQTPNRAKPPSAAPPLVAPRSSSPAIPSRSSAPELAPRKSAPELASRKSAPEIERPEKRAKVTLPHASVPPPTGNTPPPAVQAAALNPRLRTDADDRLASAMRDTEAITSVEVDAEAKAAAKAAAKTEQASEVGERTDVGVEIPRAPSSTIKTPELPGDEPIPPPTAQMPAAKEPPSRPSVPISTAPATLPPPKEALPAATGPTPACPQCEAPMQWVEEHLRFYCKQCRMYF